MPKTADTRPWAFDDCPQWRAFREKCGRAGLMFTCIDEWGNDPRRNRYRGATMAKFFVHAEGGQLVTVLIAEGRGPDGFEVFFVSPRLDIDADVAWLADLARKAAEVQP